MEGSLTCTLAIESSCDDLSCAVLSNNRAGIKILSNIVYSQDYIHSVYGGVVPELASRNHIKTSIPVLHAALSKAGIKLRDIDFISATAGPGLVGSLLVGLMTAKTLSYALKKPFARINHIEGHIFSPFLETQEEFPFIALVISGGHSHIYIVKSHTGILLLGKTRDDACGEAFDKISNYLNYGYPGGRIVDEMAEKGDKKAFNFSLPMEHSGNLDFSFSGLKTQAINIINRLGGPGKLKEGAVYNLFASYREAIAAILLKKVLSACKMTGVKTVVISGGVSANSRIRSLFNEILPENKIKPIFPSQGLSTDNAAMIGYVGFFKDKIDPVKDKEGFYNINADPSWEL